MSGEFRRPPPEGEGIELDPEVRRIVTRYWWAARAVAAAYFALLFGGTAVAFLRRGPVVAVVVFTVVFLVGNVRVFRIRSEITLVTDRPADAVRSEFRRPANPITPWWFGRADEVTSVEDPDAVAVARLETTYLLLFSNEFRAGVSERRADPVDGSATVPGSAAAEDPDRPVGPAGDRSRGPDPLDRTDEPPHRSEWTRTPTGSDGSGSTPGTTASKSAPGTRESGSTGGTGGSDPVHGSAGPPTPRPGPDDRPILLWLAGEDGVGWTAGVEVEEDEGRTRITIEAEPPRLATGRELLLLPVEARLQGRIFDHFGYEKLDSDLRIGVSLTGPDDGDA